MKQDLPKLDDKTRLLLRNPLTGARMLLWANILIVGCFLIWAYFAEIDERTQGQGKVVPSTQVKEIQNLEGGILKKLYVSEGSLVKKGEKLLQLSETQFSSQLKETEANYAALEAQRIRLLAESKEQASVRFPTVLIEEFPNFVDHERELFNLNREAMNQATTTLNNTLHIAQKQLHITEPLAKQKIVSELDLLKLQREVNEIKGKLSSHKKEYLTKVREQLVKTNSELKAIDEKLYSLRDRLDRTSIISPVQGVVKKINIDTIGGVVKSGEEIMQIVPVDDQLLISAKIAPSNIAFLRVGQEADVRISAYDPSIYGSLKGKVLRISADAIVEKDAQGREVANYRVMVKTKHNYLTYKGEELPIIPGMQATVGILTGKKTILTYLMKPILKAKQNALSER